MGLAGRGALLDQPRSRFPFNVVTQILLLGYFTIAHIYERTLISYLEGNGKNPKSEESRDYTQTCEVSRRVV